MKSHILIVRLKGSVKIAGFNMNNGIEDNRSLLPDTAVWSRIHWIIGWNKQATVAVGALCTVHRHVCSYTDPDNACSSSLWSELEYGTKQGIIHINDQTLLNHFCWILQKIQQLRHKVKNNDIASGSICKRERNPRWKQLPRPRNQIKQTINLFGSR